MKHNLDIGTRTYLRTVVSFANTLDKYDQYRYPDPVPPYANRWMNFTNNNKTNTWRFSSYINQKVNSRLSYRIGFTGESMGLDLLILDKTARPASAPFDTVSDYKGSPFLWQYFGQFKYRASERFSIVGGLHGTYFNLNGSNAVEPRISFSYQLPAAQTVYLSYGLHSQLQPLPVYFKTVDEETGQRDPSNRNLGLTRAHQLRPRL
ncbi:hypothetical protein ACQ86N_38030 [Puia sp. P3]|uniref:hypothetical protein n=1 Tax=Puia sp. P3 TaxID=3423952 RepID=UPI003D66605A